MPVPPKAGAANTPVNKAPTIPPTPCTPNTSNESSAPNIRLRPLTPHRHMKPATKPITIAPMGPTNPHAGVMATKPATAPDAAPNIEALPLANASPVIQLNVAAAVATSVLMNASAVTPFASRFEPALKPNQPTHNKDAPTMVKVKLCGVMASLP